MTNYATMRARIATELGRSDITAQIQDAIKSAIRHYERQRYYFNERRSSFSTSSSQEYYGSADGAFIAQLVEIDTITMNIGANTYPVEERDWEYIDRAQTHSGYVGDPTDFVYHNFQLRFYPIPQTNRAVNVTGVQKLPTLSASTDTNAWMTDGEELIRCRAKWNLYKHSIKKPDKAIEMKEAELDAETALGGETAMKTAGTVRPTQF